ncbi:MAG: LytTR family transcriptional regulator DNA-binding domain-containing protein, partial [Sphingomonadales bacterium]|nr:LytTR family transcriptional regulator DNA-binding domain-containing protein [Sphingomonadales bacterium]
MRQLVIDLGVMSVIGLVLAILGPFGTFAAPLSMRLLYWLGLSWAGYACYRPIAGMASRVSTRLDLPEGPLWVAGCLLATAPMTAMMLLIERLPGRSRPLSLDAAMTMYANVLAVGAAVTLLFYILRDRRTEAPQVTDRSIPDAPAMNSEPRFLSRIPPTRAEDVLALEMEDHYLRVHTRHGSRLILLRMRDAVTEMDGIAGEQVHRSWWVARHALAEVIRDGRNIRIRLEGGLEA